MFTTEKQRKVGDLYRDTRIGKQQGADEALCYDDIYTLSDAQCDIVIDVLEKIPRPSEVLDDGMFSGALWALKQNMMTREAFDDIIWSRNLVARDEIIDCIKHGLCVHPVYNLDFAQIRLMRIALQAAKEKGHPLSEDEQKDAIKIIGRKTYTMKIDGNAEYVAFTTAINQRQNVSNAAILSVLDVIEKNAFNRFATTREYYNYLFELANKAVDKTDGPELDDDGSR